MTDRPEAIGHWQAHFETALAGRLPPADAAPAELHQAMHYSALAGGKRMRPLLVYAGATALGLEPADFDAVACAVECIHAYSLIHDDLPAMDDDDLRRGQPTCHRAFDEATAILAGDSLQAFAFGLLAENSMAGFAAELRLTTLEALAAACGSQGMAGGQVLDLAAVGGDLDATELAHMHRLKTGALIRFSVVGPALLAGATADHREALERYGDALGLAYQIHDDVLDVTASAEELGKPSGADAARNKPTFPSVLGLDGSRAEAERLSAMAVTACGHLPGDVEALRWLAGFVVRRGS